MREPSVWQSKRCTQRRLVIFFSLYSMLCANLQLVYSLIPAIEKPFQFNHGSKQWGNTLWAAFCMWCVSLQGVWARWIPDACRIVFEAACNLEENRRLLPNPKFQFPAVKTMWVKLTWSVSKGSENMLSLNAGSKGISMLGEAHLDLKGTEASKSCRTRYHGIFLSHANCSAVRGVKSVWEYVFFQWPESESEPWERPWALLCLFLKFLMKLDSTLAWVPAAEVS